MSESRFRSLSAAAIVFSLGLLGCGGTAHEPSAAAPATVELAAVDRAGYDAVLAKHEGKVVLVDFWATWCMPCLAQLPHTAKLATERSGEGLAVVTVSMDEPNAAGQAAVQLAQRAGDAPIDRLISSLGGGSAAMEAFEITAGSAPHYKLYDRKGTLRRTFEVDPTSEQQYTPEDIEAAVVELLNEKP